MFGSRKAARQASSSPPVPNWWLMTISRNRPSARLTTNSAITSPAARTIYALSVVTWSAGGIASSLAPQSRTDVMVSGHFCHELPQRRFLLGEDGARIQDQAVVLDASDDRRFASTQPGSEGIRRSCCQRHQV